MTFFMNTEIVMSTYAWSKLDLKKAKNETKGSRACTYVCFAVNNDVTLKRHCVSVRFIVRY